MFFKGDINLGLFDTIKKGAGVGYLEEKDTSSKKTAVKKVNEKPMSDRELKVLEVEVSKAIEKLQNVQEKLRVRRGI
tara:strand:+ start:1323 stop:1553 length:231 start_codon:yes stop_codon:yes gene_type:complete